MITLIGPHQSKRTHYFMQAAAILGESVTALTHPQALDASLTSGIVKIDPPVHNETNIRKINAIGLDYIHFLQNMAARPASPSLTIRRASFTCWIKTLQAALTGTRHPHAAVGSGRRKKFCTAHRHHGGKRVASVFIKPSLGFGAAGVIALRRHPDGAKQVLYSAIAISGQQLFNSKKSNSIVRKKISSSLLMAFFSRKTSSNSGCPKPA